MQDGNTHLDLIINFVLTTRTHISGSRQKLKDAGQRTSLGLLQTSHPLSDTQFIAVPSPIPRLLATAAGPENSSEPIALWNVDANHV